jgi:dihydroneopterin aldolase/2-amino-4-hydroxy-6-hydroxymethyldihydropteridine diphosphokinase/dihydropteroate synthase
LVDVISPIREVDRSHWSKFNMNIVFVAFGSNLGNRLLNIHMALDMLPGDIIDSSFLYKTSPMYVLDQPYFYNGVVKLKTDLSPLQLLTKLNEIELELGREKIQVNGPRPIDLDIIFYNSDVIHNEGLVVPHPKMEERDFVLGPLMDLAPDFIHPKLGVSIRELFSNLEKNSLERVLPIHKKEINWTDKTLVMGILNVTPDSFSDGGLYESTKMAIQRAHEMIKEGADIIDVGGQSTRPGANIVSPDDEIERVVPVIKEIRHLHPDVIISCDTFSSQVAIKAIKAGCDIINDVTGGRADPNMHLVVSEYKKPYVITHSRGDSKTMVNLKEYENVVIDSRKEIDHLIHQALIARIYRWNIILQLIFL